MKKATEIDKFIGNKIYALRVQQCLSQRKVANFLNVSVQQIIKYEKGINRISASSLTVLAKALGVDVNYFYEGYDLKNLKIEKTGNEEFIEISSKFMKIKNTEHRNAVNVIIEALSKIRNNLIKS